MGLHGQQWLVTHLQTLVPRQRRGSLQAKDFMAGIDSFTKLLLHMDDVSLSDSELAPTKTVTLAGNVARSSTQSKFGGFSAAFDGTGDWLSLASTADFAFSTGSYTIDFWVYFTDFVGSPCVIGHGPGSGNNYSFLQIGAASAEYFIRSGASNIIDINAAHGISAGGWHHFALIRGWGADVNSFAVTVDGVAIGTGSSAASYIPADTFYIGQIGDGSQNLNGYIDEFRISKGVARWTANFTPPTAPYSIVSGRRPQSNSAILWNDF